jgi:CheY-like chemotaxis protein
LGNQVPTTDRPFVLIAEDDPASRLLAERILAAHGYPYALAADGHEVLQRVTDRRPDLILMDLSMPGMDGLTAVRHLRANAAYDGVRVLALTAHAMTGDRAGALAAGCDDYLSKPYRPNDLVAAIERLVAATWEGAGL